MNDARRTIAFPRTRRWIYSSKNGITVSSSGIPDEFRQAFLTILAETKAYYQELFGEHVIGHVEFNVRKVPRLPLRLWTNGADRIFLTLSRKDQLQPPQQSGVRHLHGLTHELAHIVLYRSLVNLSQLEQGWGEGWAVYWASFWAIPHLFARLGDAAWPYPYNYVETDGPAWYSRRIGDSKWRPENAIQEVVRDLALWHQKVGSDAFVAHFKKVLEQPLTAEEFNKGMMKGLKNIQRKRSRVKT